MFLYFSYCRWLETCEKNLSRFIVVFLYPDQLLQILQAQAIPQAQAIAVEAPQAATKARAKEKAKAKAMANKPIGQAVQRCQIF